MKSNDSARITYKKNIAFTFIAFAVYKLLSSLVFIHIENAVHNLFASELMVLTCAVVLAFVTRKLYSLKFSRQGIGTGFGVGIYIIIIDLYTIGMWIYQYIYHIQFITISAAEVILFVLSMIMVGIAEELMFRGVLLNASIDFFGEDSVTAIRKSIIITSCIFGAFHIFNVFIGANIIGVLFQALNATAMGIIFGAVYVRSGKNIWPCIILHGVHDFCVFTASGIMMGVATRDVVGSYDLSLVPSIIIMFIVAMFLIRKKKIMEG